MSAQHSQVLPAAVLGGCFIVTGRYSEWCLIAVPGTTLAEARAAAERRREPHLTWMQYGVGNAGEGGDRDSRRQLFGASAMPEDLRRRLPAREEPPP